MFDSFIERYNYPPPEYTAISRLAYNTLSSWGMKAQEIKELREMTASFKDSYGNCVEKASAISDVYIDKRMKMAIIPHFHDAMGRSFGGECTDIAWGLALKLHLSGIIDDVNKRGNGDKELKVFIANCNNQTHFRKGAHAVVGLAQEHDAKSTKLVAVDGAYQRISHLHDREYKLRGKIFPHQRIERSLATGIFLSPMYFALDGVLVDLDTLDATILGQSDDKSVALTLGFTRHEDTYLSFIGAIDKTGIACTSFVKNPLTGNINHFSNRRQFSITKSAMNEIVDILVATTGINYSPIENAPPNLTSDMTIAW